MEGVLHEPHGSHLFHTEDEESWAASSPASASSASTIDRDDCMRQALDVAGEMARRASGDRASAG